MCVCVRERKRQIPLTVPSGLKSNKARIKKFPSLFSCNSFHIFISFLVPLQAMITAQLRQQDEVRKTARSDKKAKRECSTSGDLGESAQSYQATLRASSSVGQRQFWQGVPCNRQPRHRKKGIYFISVYTLLCSLDLIYTHAYLYLLFFLSGNEKFGLLGSRQGGRHKDVSKQRSAATCKQ